VYDILSANPTANPPFFAQESSAMSVPVPKEPAFKASDSSTNFEEMLQRLEEEFERFSPKALNRFFFSFDGLDFDVRAVEQEKTRRFLITATIGYMPFTIEADERREAIRAIITGSRTLPKVRFGVDMGSLISAAVLYDITEIVFPDIIFYPLTLFLQEARPFINLIGKYLFKPAEAAKQKQDATPAVKDG
jgi:hypothetical protein